MRQSCGDGRTADPAVQPEPSWSPGKRASRLWDCLPLPGGGQESAGEVVASPDPPASAPAADSRGSSEPPVQYFSGSAMKEALLSALRRAESSVRATLYLIDDPEVCQLLAKKVREPGITVELLLDAGQCNPSGSCARQPQCLLQMIEWGVKVLKARSSRSTRGFSIVHNKLWVIDGSK